MFWDQTFAVSFFAPRWPALARSILLYRCRRLAAAKQAARAAGLEGAMFPWRSASSGEDETPPLQPNSLSGDWLPDYTCLQRHVGAIIVHDVLHYHAVTGDDAFLLGQGAELVVEIARFWASAATAVPGTDRLDLVGVVGPDEYHTILPGKPPGLRGDAYTNVMAAWTLRRAAELLDAREGLRRRLGVKAEETERWTRVASKLRLVFHDDGVLSQFDGYAQLAPLDLGSCDDPPAAWTLRSRRRDGTSTPIRSPSRQTC